MRVKAFNLSNFMEKNVHLPKQLDKNYLYFNTCPTMLRQLLRKIFKSPKNPKYRFLKSLYLQIYGKMSICQNNLSKNGNIKDFRFCYDVKMILTFQKFLKHFKVVTSRFQELYIVRCYPRLDVVRNFTCLRSH